MTANARYEDVAAVNSTLAWAVGSEGETGAPREVLIRWNGTAWRRTDLPGVIRLTGVSADATNRAWIVGQAGPGDPWGESPYAGRLTASGWAPATNGIAPGAVPTAVATRGSTTILVGYRPAVYTAFPVLLQWNGSRWESPPLNAPKNEGGFNDVAVAGDGSVFAVGAGNDTQSESGGLILSRRGGRWHTHRIVSASGRVDLFGVWGGSAKEAWAVGVNHGNDYVDTPLVLRWDGTAWRRMSVPLKDVQLLSVTRDSTGAVWVSARDRGQRDIPLLGAPVLRYAAGAWSVHYFPRTYPARAPELDDLAAVPGSSRVWGVGSQPRLHGSLLKNFGLVAVNR
ncbi:hypothetical protein [Nostocoides australiense]|uniref:hypothetical protein n=1 Tax=Nostocoides australiense TaxID=99480 RepID=UPI00138ED0D8|nr:hypothetical protein [Tetrasphaera australiensis]